MTRSPTVMVPSGIEQSASGKKQVKKQSPCITPCAAMNIVKVSTLEKITFCPEFRYAKLVITLTFDLSYSAKCLSY